MEYRMRHMQPIDVIDVIGLGDEQNARDGTHYPVPRIYGGDGRLVESVPLALVVECDGQVRQAQVFTRTIEMMVFGVDPRATAVSRREMARAGWLLRQRGYTGVHCQVPKEKVKLIEGPLGRAGFERDDANLAHFFRSLVDPDESK